MQGAICLRCGEPLNQTNESSEHIILESLGGRLKSLELLCGTCNNFYGETFDAELSKQIPLPTLLGLKLQGREPIKVLLKNSSGQGVYIDKDFKSSKEKPNIEEGKRYEYRNDQEASRNLKSLKRKFPNAKFNQRELLTHWDEPFSPQYDLIVGEAFKSVVKSAIEFFIYSGGELNQIEYARFYLNSNSCLNNLVKYYYEQPLEVHLAENEISHTIVLSANPESGICYCYIELFSVHCFLVILNRNYVGRQIHNTYSFDLVQRTEINKSIPLKISKTAISSIHFPYDEYSNDGFFARLKRAYKIKGIRMEVKKRKM